MTSATEQTPVRDCELDGWVETVQELRGEGFDYFDWLTAVDETDREESPGFDVVLHLYDMTPGAVRGTLVRCRVPEGTPVPSLTSLWCGAAWHERETHEMFGIEFSGFDDGTGLGMRPLLLPDGFVGTPLRKSFVLAARASKPWPGAKDPGESGDTPRRAGRRKNLPPGVPDPSWGPR
ncbi:NADH-quinone oxidoreductase subunit C [Luteipulveratus sp. YIM 133132]|uniref:NADH-quinone oxidoreductase subunit C n=1 Tax=Luteipulveratus flavus TaxID=3031728 RepID=UPI0023AFDDC1|nr:NADH-quinone oxidoreductase subunit C [Luteipulveratus sp. YIM 133132]MDE9365131.1 NADH-quinone oxidoreductase subunit C [Luteipulveratus sp. YIM 133132]